MRMPAEVATIDVAKVQALLDRITALIAPDDHAVLTALLKTLLGVLEVLRKRTTTIARLRRFLGIVSSEKTRDVLGGKDDQGGSGPDGRGPREGCGTGAASGSGASSTAPVNDPSEGHRPGGADAPSPSPPAPEPEGKKGHGRLGVADYPDARHCPLSHESLQEGQICPLCGRGKLYALPPVHWWRITGQVPLVAECTCAEQFRCSACGKTFTATVPPELVTCPTGGRIDVMGVAIIAHLRFMGGMPHYRLEQIQKNLRTPLPASTQWEALAAAFVIIRPVVEELPRQAAQADVFFIDDTRGPVLQFMGKRRAALVEKGELPNPDRTGLFTTGIVARLALGLVVALFKTSRQHAGENVKEVLAHRDRNLALPILMSDALSSNTAGVKGVVPGNCIPHARRNFVEQLENFPQDCSYVLLKLAVVFKVDAQARRDELSAEERLRLHQEQSQPVMDELKAWMERQFQEKRVEPNSGLGQAINYMRKRWEAFTLFLRIPGAPLDNNTAERALKAAIRHRRNSLFYRTDKGARVGDGFMSLLYTAELNGENPIAYLVELLRHPDAVARSPRDWLPWTYRATLARSAGACPTSARAGPLTAGKRPAA